ncbi:hypothetical protein LA081_03305 [Mycoplasmopsis synoviae]|nr:hypothetical protein LA081_03305 [Mycoplasmopsis synoviae]
MTLKSSCADWTIVALKVINKLNNLVRRTKTNIAIIDDHPSRLGSELVMALISAENG